MTGPHRPRRRLRRVTAHVYDDEFEDIENHVEYLTKRLGRPVSRSEVIRMALDQFDAVAEADTELASRSKL